VFDFLGVLWDDVFIVMYVLVYLFKVLVVVALSFMLNGGSVVGLIFDGWFVWLVYDWMGVVKVVFELIL